MLIAYMLFGNWNAARESHSQGDVPIRWIRPWINTLNCYRNFC